MLTRGSPPQLKKTEKNEDGTAKTSKTATDETSIESKFPEKMLLQLKGRKNVRFNSAD